MQAENEVSSRRLVFREEIRSTIRDAIFSGALKPGDRVIETYWAKEMGVSQGPVREAIRDLEAMGLVETVPFKGSRVRVMTEKEFRDNYSVRICLESKSIRDAIADLSDSAMGNLLAVLGDILSDMEICAAEGNLQKFTDYDTLFHRSIIESTGNAVLLKMWEQCNLRLWFKYSILTDSKSLTQLQKSHDVIFRAIAKRNVNVATSTMEEHLTSLMDGFLKQG